MYPIIIIIVVIKEKSLSGKIMDIFFVIVNTSYMCIYSFLEEKYYSFFFFFNFSMPQIIMPFFKFCTISLSFAEVILR